MRFVVIFIIFLFSSYAYSEEYICAYSYDDKSLPHGYERISDDKFISTDMNGNQIIAPVLLEENNYLILGQLVKYKFKGKEFNGYRVTFIDKKLKEFQTYSISEPKHKDLVSNLNSGTCAIFN